MAGSSLHSNGGVDWRNAAFTTGHFYSGNVRYFGYVVADMAAQLEPLLGELSRITSDRCLVTVPDISSIPMCFLQNVVPWHILEETHVNFFTPDSLRNLLKKYFSTVLMGKICPSQTNDALWHESLLAVCRKK